MESGAELLSPFVKANLKQFFFLNICITQMVAPAMVFANYIFEMSKLIEISA